LALFIKFFYNNENQVWKRVSLYQPEELQGLRAIQSIAHPNIVPIRNIFRDDTFLYICMPEYSPITISQINAFSKLDKLSFIEGVASAIKRLHSNNPPLIHKDIKIDNILVKSWNLGSGLEVCIADFSTTRYADTPSSTQCTRLIMPPEAYRQNYAATATDSEKLAWDIYAFGKLLDIVNLDEMTALANACTCEAPLKRPTISEILKKIRLTLFTEKPFIP